MIEFRIDRRSGVATYLQIAQQVKDALRLGLLGCGDRLPTAKEVVAATAINPNTVLRAYQDLSREGLVESRPGLGTFVSKSLTTPAMAADTPLRGGLDDWMTDARAAGLTREEVEVLVKVAIDKVFDKR